MSRGVRNTSCVAWPGMPARRAVAKPTYQGAWLSIGCIPVLEVLEESAVKIPTWLQCATCGDSVGGTRRAGVSSGTAVAPRARVTALCLIKLTHFFRDMGISEDVDGNPFNSFPPLLPSTSFLLLPSIPFLLLSLQLLSSSSHWYRTTADLSGAFVWCICSFRSIRCLHSCSSHG